MSEGGGKISLKELLELYWAATGIGIFHQRKCEYHEIERLSRTAVAPF